jgi:exodeoxyribonuclease VII large subunit
MRQFSVTELLRRLSGLVKSAFPEKIRVTGEVTGIATVAGNTYFSLMDTDTPAPVKPKIKCVYFRSDILKGAFIPKNGDKVEAEGEADLYPGEGTFQIKVKRIEYNTEGEYWKAFELLCKNLEKEGLFDTSRKKKPQSYPKRIALLTSEKGAAINDFLVTVKAKGLFFDIDVFPIPVQGRENAPAIASAIAKAGEAAHRYDILVLTRGGGALEDLAVFNDERVVRALAASKVVTLSAIGHERDSTVSDFVADIRAATPTAAAEFLIREYAAAMPLTEKFYKSIINSLKNRRKFAIINLDKYDALIRSGGAMNKRLDNYRVFIDGAAQKISSRLREFVIKYDRELSLLSGRLMASSPGKRLPLLNASVDALNTRLINTARLRYGELSSALGGFEERLRLTDPERLLSVGYSILYKNGAVISQTGDLAIGDEVSVRLKDGMIDAVVERKNNVLD